MELTTYLSEMDQKINQALEKCLPHKGHPLFAAMNYSLLGPGKRLRPILCLAANTAAGGNSEDAMYCACALEMIHCYSLIHDDLPAMDNDDYRRGRLTNHKVYGQAMAILAGDGLLTEAFALLSSPPPSVPAEIALKVSGLLARAAGAHGMVGGQADDMEENKELSLEYLKSMHARKTGALISASLVSGAMLAGAGSAFMRIVQEYGENIGLAFQIADDILDVEGKSQELGKTAGKDSAQGKLTYPALLGLAESKALGHELAGRAAALAEQMNSRPLALIAGYVMSRKK